MSSKKLLSKSTKLWQKGTQVLKLFSIKSGFTALVCTRLSPRLNARWKNEREIFNIEDADRTVPRRFNGISGSRALRSSFLRLQSQLCIWYDTPMTLVDEELIIDFFAFFIVYLRSASSLRTI